MAQTAQRRQSASTPPPLKEGTSMHQPIVPATQNLPEITFKSIVLGLILAVLLCASTTYVGLKLGRTIAGSIPAAVMSIMLLGWFKRTNILEHNIVQTAASAGEVVSAGVIFTLPALVMMGYWDGFNYMQTAAIVAVGGFLGVCFSIPLRRIMVVEQALPYPEGIATAEVLKAGEAGKGGKMLMSGGIIAAIISSLQECFHILATEIQVWRSVGTSAFGFGLEFSPVLMGAGYIVGLGIALPILFGGIITWAIGIPLYGFLYGLPDVADGGTQAAVMALWKSKFRYMGVGAMLVGGLWGVYSILGPIKQAISSSLQSRRNQDEKVERTQHDMSMKFVIRMGLFLAIPLYIIFSQAIKTGHWPVGSGTTFAVTALCVVLAIGFGFVCAAIGAYMTGLVGSTCLPVSGITISGLLVFSTVLLLTIGQVVNFSVNKEFALAASGATIIFGSIIALATSLSSDNMQDLKAGYVVGATPWKQQVMLMVGVVAAALVIAPVLQLLYTAYGFADSLPRPGMNPAEALAAPQATLMATVAKGIFAGSIQWTMVGIGAGLGVVIIALDQMLKARGSTMTLPVLSLALGMYLPLSYVTPLVIGGLLAHYAARKRGNTEAHDHGDTLFASGVIAGHALIGVLIAIPMAQGFNFKTISPDLPKMLTLALGAAAFAWLGHRVYKIGASAK